MPYFGAVTGDKNEPGIDGASLQRQSVSPEVDQPLNGFACTMGVESYDLAEVRIVENSGKVAVSKYALPGLA